MAESDHKAAVPVRSETDVHEKVHVKIVDFDNPETQQVRVDTDKNAHVEVHGNKPTTNDDVPLLLSEEGFSNSRGDYDVADNTRPSSHGLIIHTRQTTPGQTHLVFRPTGIKSTKNQDVYCQDVAIRDEQGNPYTENNPLYVTYTDSEGDEVHDEFTSVAAVAKNASDTHTYTVPVGKIFLLEQILCRAAIRAKFTIEYGPVGSLSRLDTLFSAANENNPDVTYKREKVVGEGEVVRITRANTDQQSSSLYSTIIGILKDPTA